MVTSRAVARTLGMGGVVSLVAAMGCSADVPPGEGRKSTTSNQFFENSVRRDATAAEASRVAQLVTSKCASFFLENTANKTYIATARHCVEFQITSWCTNDGAIVDNSGTRGRCTRVVAGDRNRDIAVIEADLPHPSTGEATLRLASYVPSVNTKLVMTGYPADSDPQTARRGRLTTTESCWVLGGPVQSPYAAQDQDTLDLSAQHNCSTYGGNSGGPMYIQGTREAIGLPFTYLDDYTRNSATDLRTAAFLALMADFVGAHRAALTAAGIVISEGPDQAGGATSGDAPPPVVDAEPEDTTGEDVGTAPASDDATDDTFEDGEEEETPAPKKKKKRPAPTMMTSGGCTATGAAPAPASTLLGLGVAVLVLRARRRSRDAALRE